MRKRPIKISLRLNEQEHEHLKQQAMLSGFPMEVFLRALISGMNLRSRPLAEYAEIRRQLAGIGNNINQIAHVEGRHCRSHDSTAGDLADRKAALR